MRRSDFLASKNAKMNALARHDLCPSEFFTRSFSERGRGAGDTVSALTFGAICS